MFEERKIIETKDEEPPTFKKTWYEARATYTRIAQMDPESIGNKMLGWVGGTLSNTLQLANNREDGLTKDIRVEKNIYGLCGPRFVPSLFKGMRFLVLGLNNFPSKVLFIRHRSKGRVLFILK
eukprot:Pgem_evm1s18330